MKKYILSMGTFVVLATLSTSSFGQVNSATMYKGISNIPGTSGSYYGKYCDASGTQAFGGGHDSDATGPYSLALGVRNRATNSHSTAIGIDLQATGNRSMIIGSGTSSGGDLVNGIASSLMIGFNSTAPTLFVGGAPTSTGTGYVGIGTSTPAAALEVADNNGTDIDTKLGGFTLIDGADASLLLGSNSGSTHGDWGIEATTDGLNFWAPFGGVSTYGNNRLFIMNNGNVCVGTTDSKGYNFAVAGDMVAEEIVVKLQANWPDFVFTKNYGLMDLDEVESYISMNSHLPNVPSASEIEESGINLGEMDGILLQKIEELTLYVLELKHENDALDTKIESLQEQLNTSNK